MQDSILNKLNNIKNEYERVSTEIQDPSVLSDIKKYKDLSKKQAKLEPTYKVYIDYLKQIKSRDEALEIIKIETNDEMLAFAREELSEAKKAIDVLEEELFELLAEKDPNDEKDVVVEIKGAAGGDEANIFAGDLYRMYSSYASKMDWTVEIIDYEESERNAYSFISFEISGIDVYKHMKFESGVHRVQRIPKTETQGRVHTSTATVLVTPISDETNHDVQIPSNELRIDTYRASGAGGQHINKTDSAVRITHIPTGIIVASQQGRSQHDNKDKAMQMLYSKIIEMKLQEERQEQNAIKKTLVGSGDRSEKIRTYNYQQNRVTDHRISFTLKKLDRIMQGDLEEIIEVLLASENEMNNEK